MKNHYGFSDYTIGLIFASPQEWSVPPKYFGLPQHRVTETPIRSKKQSEVNPIRCRVGVEVVVTPCCNALTLQLEHSGGRGSNPTSTFERHDKNSRTRLVLSYFCDLSAWR